MRKASARQSLFPTIRSMIKNLLIPASLIANFAPTPAALAGAPELLPGTSDVQVRYTPQGFIMTDCSGYTQAERNMVESLYYNLRDPSCGLITLHGPEYDPVKFNLMTECAKQDPRAKKILLQMCNSLRPGIDANGNYFPPAGPLCAQRTGMPTIVPNGTIELSPNGVYTNIRVCGSTGTPRLPGDAFKLLTRNPAGGVNVSSFDPFENLFNVTFEDRPGVSSGLYGQGCRFSIVRRYAGATGSILATNLAIGGLQVLSQKATCNVEGMTAADNLEIMARMCLNPDVGGLLGSGDPGPDAPTVSREQVMEKVRDMGIVSHSMPIYGSSFCNPRRTQQPDMTVGELCTRVKNTASKFCNSACKSAADKMNRLSGYCGF